ncbi:MAG: macro domain-containing protein [Lentisphaerae bacterium]|nr:macro domain-containing protein [Lentisphaerota bacterium]
MIAFKTGDILAEEAEALVNTVNCVGIMGRGIALQFKNRFPENFTAYADACKRQTVAPGKMFVFETGNLTYPRLIINFPTKRHWRGKSRLEDIDAGLKALAHEIRDRKITSIAIPPLGCGLGGLDWSQVRPRIEAELRPFEKLKAVVFEPSCTPADTRANISTDVPKMTPGRAALVCLMSRYLQGLLDPFITLLEVHKLMYFLLAAGEPLKLQYAKAPYGPYAENLRHVLKKVEGHLISGYADGGDAPDKQLSLVPCAQADAETFLQTHETTRKNIDRVADLVDGFETPFGLELLSTVHWVVVHEHAQTLDFVIKKTYGWNDHKKQFTPRQIGLAIDILTQKGWMTPLGGSVATLTT